MSNTQKIYFTARDSDYLHKIIYRKDWQALIELASINITKNDLLFRYFQTDESKEVLKSMTEDQILTLIDYSSEDFANNILDRMESLCDSDTKFTNIALNLMKDVYGHGGHLRRSSIVKCLPINVLKIIIDCRIPFDEFHFGPNKQEFFLYILQALSGNSKNNYNYKNLKENDTLKQIFTYIIVESNTFPLGRREVFKEVIQSFRESFMYIENNDNIKPDSSLINHIINPIYNLIIRGLENPYWDYKNDLEIISQLKSIFDEFYYSKYFRPTAKLPILLGTGNESLLSNSKVLEETKVITRNYYYKVFKKAVEDNKDNFNDEIASLFFLNIPMLKYIRELDDKVYKKLFKTTIEVTVRNLIEKKSSENFSYCCRLLSPAVADSNCFFPRYEECILFIKTVISKIFAKKSTLNVDVTTYPEICLYLLNSLTKKQVESTNVSYLVEKVNESVHTPLDFLDDDMRNKLILGIIRHPVDDTKFTHIITSNNPTTLVKLIYYMKNVEDAKLILPRYKRSTVDKYGFREYENSKMNLVEIFLHTLKFWENQDKTIFTQGYISYYQFVRKILIESIVKKDIELKKAAIDAYYRFSELVSLKKNAKYIDIRIKIASKTFLMPVAVIVGSEIDPKFVENYIKKFIEPFNSHSYHHILSETISRSHVELEYDDDIDSSFINSINIDQQYAISTRLILQLIKSNAVKDFSIYTDVDTIDEFFVSKKKYFNYIKNRFENQNRIILAVCNPLLTEYPLPIEMNSPQIDHTDLTFPKFQVSQFVFLELARFVGEEFSNYSPKMFNTNLTKTLIQIQEFLKKLPGEGSDTFQYYFTLDQPTVDTDEKEYSEQSHYEINVLYSHSFFHFLNEINRGENSIYNDECYEIVKKAYIARFLNEEDFLKQQNLPAPRFDGFDIFVKFRKHRDARSIFNLLLYKERVDSYKYNIYRDTNGINDKLKEQIEKFYANSRMLGDRTIDDEFTIDQTIHRNHSKSETAGPAKYRKNIHKVFTQLIDALNKSDANDFSKEFDSLVLLKNFNAIRKSGSSSESYSMLTKLFDLLIDDFVSNKMDDKKLYKNRLATTEDVYKFMLIVSNLAGSNLGQLNNLEKLTKLSEKVVSEKVNNNREMKLFENILKSGNLEQILVSMNCSLFSINAATFSEYLLRRTSLSQNKSLINGLINEVTTNNRPILDEFHVALSSMAIHPLFVGYPIPGTNLEYLKKITSKSLTVKRSSCANAVYYAIMNFTSGKPVPLAEIMDVITSAHEKCPDEMTAFFCLLISEQTSIEKMNQLPALRDLADSQALPTHFIIKQGPKLQIPKEIGDLYYGVIEKVILSGLKSKKSHIYELTVTVLNELDVSTEIQRIISPYIKKGLKDMEASEDNSALIRYATSFTMKNSNEIEGIFDIYCETLEKIKKHSFRILKANLQMNQNSPYPEAFKKLEETYLTIIETIEKPFNEFKQQEEMIKVSEFCRKLVKSLNINRPAVGRDIFFKLVSYSSIFGDENIEEMVNLYKEDKKEGSLSCFIKIVTNHDELVINVPSSIENIYYKLRSSFTVKHTIELSKSLFESQSKLNVSLQRAYHLAQLLAPDVLSHMPEEKDLSNDQQLVEILSNLGIFCKNNHVVPYPVDTQEVLRESGEAPLQKQQLMLNKMVMPMRKANGMAAKTEDCCVEEVDADDFEQEDELLLQQFSEDAVDAEDAQDEVDIDEGAGNNDDEEVDGNQDQARDAFDVFQ